VNQPTASLEQEIRRIRGIFLYKRTTPDLLISCSIDFTNVDGEE
jgi:hypothetical protein